MLCVCVPPVQVVVTMLTSTNAAAEVSLDTNPTRRRSVGQVIKVSKSWTSYIPVCLTRPRAIISRNPHVIGRPVIQAHRICRRSAAIPDLQASPPLQTRRFHDRCRRSVGSVLIGNSSALRAAGTGFRYHPQRLRSVWRGQNSRWMLDCSLAGRCVQFDGHSATSLVVMQMSNRLEGTKMTDCLLCSSN